MDKEQPTGKFGRHCNMLTHLKVSSRKEKTTGGKADE
jgi:hypothetical protein